MVWFERGIRRLLDDRTVGIACVTEERDTDQGGRKHRRSGHERCPATGGTGADDQGEDHGDQRLDRDAESEEPAATLPIPVEHCDQRIDRERHRQRVLRMAPHRSHREHDRGHHDGQPHTAPAGDVQPLRQCIGGEDHRAGKEYLGRLQQQGGGWPCDHEGGELFGQVERRTEDGDGREEHRHPGKGRNPVARRIDAADGTPSDVVGASKDLPHVHARRPDAHMVDRGPHSRRYATPRTTESSGHRDGPLPPPAALTDRRTKVPVTAPGNPPR